MIQAALVLEGGSYRGMFSAGALDILMDAKLWFAYVNGVSAGSLVACSYLSRQPGRSRDINETFCNDPRYVGLRNLVQGSGVFDFDFLFGNICDVLNPMDADTLFSSPQKFEVVATDCLTGRPAYFEKSALGREAFLTACRASSSMPGLADIVWLRHVPYLDGGCSCPIAYQRALDLGYDKIVVVRTRPEGYRKKPDNRPSMDRAFHRLYRRYPALEAALRQMPRRYNAACAELEELERTGRIFVVRPDGPVTVKRLERSPEKLEELYQDGRRIMVDQLDGLMRYLHNA